MTAFAITSGLAFVFGVAVGSIEDWKIWLPLCGVGGLVVGLTAKSFGLA